MESNDRDIDWLKEAPTLAAIGREIPFTVPQGYFETSSDLLRARILIESHKLDLEKQFHLPPDYFDQLPGRIENRIALENIKTLIPSDGFTVPRDYFSDLSERISLKIDQNISRKPVRRSLHSLISYSAAACITLLIGSVIYFNSSGYNFGKQLSQVPDQEIINYLQIHSTVNDIPIIIENLSFDGMQQVTPDVSSEELEQYINNTTL